MALVREGDGDLDLAQYPYSAFHTTVSGFLNLNRSAPLNLLLAWHGIDTYSWPQVFCTYKLACHRTYIKEIGSILNQEAGGSEPLAHLRFGTYLSTS
jgi:hypothetical protein